MKKVKEESNTSKGFTLLELLVVVIIIGILAAIALPQYKKAVLKSTLNGLKEIVNAVNAATVRYYYANDKYPESYADLDIELPAGRYWGNNEFYESEDGITCSLDHHQTSCGKNKLRYGTHISSANGFWKIRKSCDVLSELDPTTLRHKVCQEETNKTSADVYCKDNWCRYWY